MTHLFVWLMSTLTATIAGCLYSRLTLYVGLASDEFGITLALCSFILLVVAVNFYDKDRNDTAVWFSFGSVVFNAAAIALALSDELNIRPEVSLLAVTGLTLCYFVLRFHLEIVWQYMGDQLNRASGFR